MGWLKKAWKGATGAVKTAAAATLTVVAPVVGAMVAPKVAKAVGTAAAIGAGATIAGLSGGLISPNQLGGLAGKLLQGKKPMDSADAQSLLSDDRASGQDENSLVRMLQKNWLYLLVGVLVLWKFKII